MNREEILQAVNSGADLHGANLYALWRRNSELSIDPMLPNCGVGDERTRNLRTWVTLPEVPVLR